MMNETPNEISTTNSRGNNTMKKFTKLFKNQKGLTLIELLAVIVILAIVAAIAVPAIGGIISNSKDKAILAGATTIIAGAKLAYTSGDCKGSSTGAVAPAIGDAVCDGLELAPYVDGITLTAGDYVTKANWTLTWAGLTGFSSTTSKYYFPTTTQTEQAILGKLNQ